MFEVNDVQLVDVHTCTCTQCTLKNHSNPSIQPHIHVHVQCIKKCAFINQTMLLCKNLKKGCMP